MSAGTYPMAGTCGISSTLGLRLAVRQRTRSFRDFSGNAQECREILIFTQGHVHSGTSSLLVGHRHRACRGERFFGDVHGIVVCLAKVCVNQLEYLLPAKYSRDVSSSAHEAEHRTSGKQRHP